MEYGINDIRERIKANLVNTPNTIEGGFTMSNIGAVSQELARIVAMEILPIPDNIMIDTAEGILLDRKALDFNEIRNVAVSASGVLQFTGDIGVVIPAKTLILLESDNMKLFQVELQIETIEEAMISVEGSCDVKAVVKEKGLLGNIDINSKIKLEGYLKGIYKVTNKTAFTGGVDEETDIAFRARILEKIRKPITSGNKNHYIYWAKQVSGIGAAKVISCWNGNGTVKVILLSNTFDIPTDDVVQDVILNIEENRPIGADVTVIKATPLLVLIDITVVIGSGYLVDHIKAKIEIVINEYLQTIAFDENKNLSYYKIGDIIFDIEGVKDITNYTLNEGTVSLQTSIEQFFKLSEVMVNGS